MPPSLTEARAELTNFLHRAMSRGLIDGSQVDAITSQWDGNTRSLPLPLDNTFQHLTEDLIRWALLGMQNLNPSWRSKDRTVNEMEEIFAAMSLRRLRHWHEKAQDSMERKSRRLAFALVAGAVTLRQWHRLMRDNVIGHLLRQTLLGGRGIIRDRDTTERIMQRELAYLSRFGDEVAAHHFQGREFSAEYLAHRASAYGGVGRGQFYINIERNPELLTRLQPFRKPYGLVAEFIARDDENTCQPCHEAQGFYPLGVGPFPGIVCLGRARCRCRRVLRYRPEIFATLV